MRALMLVLLISIPTLPRSANAQEMPAMPVELRAGLVARFDEASEKSREHLGQLVYARISGVVPPWSARQ